MSTQEPEFGEDVRIGAGYLPPLSPASFSGWKRFLLGKESGLGPFTQHLFIVVDKQRGTHKGLGGQVYADSGLVFSHIGPLFIVGLFDRKRLRLPDLTIWDRSKIEANSGIVEPIAEWHTPPPMSKSAKHANITYEMALLLFCRIRQAEQLAVEAREQERLGRIGIQPKV